MSFKTKVDYGTNNRQLKQYQYSNTVLSGTTTFGVEDVYIPENFTAHTINIDARQFIRTKGLIFPSELSGVTATTANTVLARNSEDGVVGEVQITQLDTVYRGTYAELTTLVTANELIVGNRYVLTDYKTIYQIENTNTDDIIEQHTVLGPSVNHAYFGTPGISSESLQNGDVITIVGLPDGYGGPHNTGDTATVIDYYNSEYIQFSPTINEAGIIIELQNQRYPQFTGGTTVVDTSGNTVMQSGGVLNTDVHNDLSYMNMSAVENPSPKIEEIVLTAIDIDKFSIDAESLTFLGDTLLYYFEDNIIYDENSVQIGTRNGLIKKREAFDLNISVDKDWRTQRYRRWKVDDDVWTGYTLTNDLYKIGATNVCTTVNNTIGDGHKYIAPTIKNTDFYLDFVLTGNTDPFLSGASAPSVLGGDRFWNDFATEYSHDIILPLSGVSEAKDFHIFPIVDESATTLTQIFKVEKLTNTVCLGESQRYGDSGNYFVEVKGKLNTSTFMSGVNIYSDGGKLENITSIDAMDIINGGFNSYITKMSTFSYGAIYNDGGIRNCMFGGARSGSNDFTDMKFDSGCEVFNGIFGTIRNDSTTCINLKANKLLLKSSLWSNSKISGNMYLTHIQTTPWCHGTHINVMAWYDNNPLKGTGGYFYEITGDINDKYVTNFYGSKNIIHEYTDSLNVVQLITKSTLQ